MDERKARYSPEKVAKFANVCAALHNICKWFKVPEPPHEFSEDTVDVEVPQPNFNNKSSKRRHAETIRNKIRDVL